jgi:hypothetical protein
VQHIAITRTNVPNAIRKPSDRWFCMALLPTGLFPTANSGSINPVAKRFASGVYALRKNKEGFRLSTINRRGKRRFIRDETRQPPISLQPTR